MTDRLLYKSAAWLFLVSALLGLFAGAAAQDMVTADFHSALASHLGAILGSLLLCAVAASLPHLRYAEPGRRRLAWAFIVPVWANALLTALKSLLGVRGLQMTGDAANDAIAILLILLVVVPTLGAAGGWAAGFKKS